MLRTVTIRMQDVSQGNDKVSGFFRMFRKVAIRFQDVTQGFKQALNDGGNALMVL